MWAWPRAGGPAHGHGVLCAHAAGTHLVVVWLLVKYGGLRTAVLRCAQEEDEAANTEEQLYKVLVIGDYGVGKTSIIRVRASAKKKKRKKKKEKKRREENEEGSKEGEEEAGRRSRSRRKRRRY